MTPIRSAVVGLGQSGYLLHSKPMTALPDHFKVVAVCDVVKALADQRASEFRAKAFYDFDQLMADPSIEAVVLSLPNHLHHQFALRAADAGKHVIVEKPMAVNTREAAEMIARARERRVLITAYFNRRWYSAFLAIRKLFAQGAFGRVFRYESGVSSWSPKLRDGWRAKAGTSGEALYDFGAHLLDETLCLFKSPARVFAQKWRAFGGEVDTAFCITMMYPDGMTAVTRILDFTRTPFPRFHIMGEKGALTGAPGNTWGELILRRENDHGETEEFKPPQEKGEIEDAAKNFYLGVFRAIREGAPLDVKPEEAYEVTRVIEAAELSAAQGRVVELSEIPPLQRGK